MIPNNELVTRLRSTTIRSVLSNLIAVTGSQPAIQFQDEGVNVGALGVVTTIDFVGSGVTATIAGAKLTVTISGGGGGSPGGAVGDVQFNNTTFGGSAQWRYNTSGAANYQSIDLGLDGGTGSGAFLEIKTANSFETIPANYGSWWFQHYDKVAGGSPNPDNRYDAVLSYGWNINGAGGLVNSSEAGIGWFIENHWHQSGSYQFEVYLQGTTSVADGSLINRYIAFDINKYSGGATGYLRSDSFDFFASNSATAFFSVNNSGVADILGASCRLTITNSGATPGQLRFSTDATGGTSSIQNLGTGYTAFSGGFQFASLPALGVNMAMNTTSGAYGFAVLSGGAAAGVSYPFYAALSTSGTTINHLENLGSGDALLELTTKSGGGDPFIGFYDHVHQMWVGMDQSDGGKFKFGKTYGWGSDVSLMLDQSNNVTMGSLAGTGSHTVVADANGKLSAP